MRIDSKDSNNEGIMFSQIVGDPGADVINRPGTGQWLVYAKSGGLYLMDDAGTVVELIAQNGLTTQLTFAAATELTIATGAVTITQSSHTIDTQSDAGSDELDTISGGTTGDVLVIQAANTARTVVVKHATGNIECPGNADISLDDTEAALILFYDGTNWLVLNRKIVGLPFTVATGDGAITVAETTVYITKGSAAAMTLVDPTATIHDGWRMTFMATTAHAHTLDNSAGSGFNGGGAGSDVGTFGGAVADTISISAYQGTWYVETNTNVTLA